MPMNKQKVEELRQKIADLKDRWPAHSTPPAMMAELDELETELEEALRAEDKPDGKPISTGQHV
jgi:hypothetical protein